MNMDEDDSDNNGILETGLYAEFQTIPYEPPPITNGRVPKNSYGNIDVYVPSMVPRGGVHISCRLSSTAVSTRTENQQIKRQRVQPVYWV